MTSQAVQRSLPASVVNINLHTSKTRNFKAKRRKNYFEMMKG
jgi:hypothetical protein